MDHLSQKYSTKTALISLTDFYRELTDQERLQYQAGKYNLDHPSKSLVAWSVFSFLLYIYHSCLWSRSLAWYHHIFIIWKTYNYPCMGFNSSHKVCSYQCTCPLCWPGFKRVGTRLVEPVDVILVEGTLILYSKPLRELMFSKIFIDVDSDQRLTNRGRLWIDMGMSWC